MRHTHPEEQIVVTRLRQLSCSHFLALSPLDNVLPPQEVLHRKLHETIETARARIEVKSSQKGEEIS